MNAYLRRATERDIDLLYQWANNPVVCAHSCFGSEISYEEHQKWFWKMLEDGRCQQYIYVCDDEDIGQIRLDISNDEAEIGYSIQMNKRCMGHGKIMLQLLARQVKADYPKVKKLTAKVKPKDIASQKAFLDMGFVERFPCYELEMDLVKTTQETNMHSGGGVLFLTNNRNALTLYDWLREHEKTNIYSEKLQICQLEALQPEFIVSYNYGYKISDKVIAYMEGRIVNLHISYLPWNRGSSPNIWSFIDDTPKGVTIHQISTGLDQGKILYQKECIFDINKETFATSYQKLNRTIVELFQDKWEEMKSGNYPLAEQKGEGSYHAKKDFDRIKAKMDFDWDENIAEFLLRYKEKGFTEKE